MQYKQFHETTAIMLFAILLLLTAHFSPSFCQENGFRPGDQIIAKDITILKNSARSSSTILAVLEPNASVLVIASQSIWVRVRSNDGKSQGWAKADEFERETQPSAPTAPLKAISVLAESGDALHHREQPVPDAPQPQNVLARNSNQLIGSWGILLATILSLFFGLSLLLLYQQNKHKQQPQTKKPGDGERKFNSLMIAYRGIEMAHKRLVQNPNGNGYEYWQSLYEELYDAFQQMAALQKQNMDEIEYLRQENDFLKKELDTM